MNNTTIYSESGITGMQRIIYFVKVTEATAITCANIAVIVLYILMGKERRKISNYLLLSQSIADMYIAIVMWFALVIDLVLVEMTPLKGLLVLISTGMLEYSLTLSLGTLMLGAVERYLSITKPYYHKCKVTLLRMIYGTVFVWTVSLIPPISLLSLMKFNVELFNSMDVIMYSFVFDGIMLTMILFVVTLLTLTLKSAGNACNRQAELTQHSLHSRRRKNSKSNASKKRMRLLVIFIIMMVAYVVTFLPLTIGRVLYDTGMLRHLSLYSQIVMITVCHLLYKCSALFNPFLTIFLKEDYRKATVKWLKRRRGSLSRKEGLSLQSYS